ncbi:Transmembrane transport protein (DitE-like protein) [Burkholderiales bacterium]|nr:Transmembrane transport protein (DitE-like protein) [Burkholderiales bacterium]
MIVEARRGEIPSTAADSPSVAVSPWSPLRHATFTVVWTATVISNIGTWMYNAASGWLMLSLNPEPLVVSLVQVATSLPIFLFALPAGALADIVDKRRFLIAAEGATTAVAAIIAALVWLGIVTPATLLLFTFVLGAGAALTAPAWQSIVPQLVPKQELAAAVAANSVGINISRALGPALGGVIIAAFGIAVPFWLNAVSNLGIVAALLWWRSPQKAARLLPAERFASAVRAGIRHTRHNSHLRATLTRAVAFFLFASAYWALLPLVAHNQIAGGPELYGTLLGAIGAGAVGGAFALPWLKAKIGPDRTVGAGTVGTAVTLVLFGLARGPVLGLSASIIAGVSWIAVLASLNVSAQVAVPDWVRGRGLAMFVTVFFGAMTVGGVVWGQVAEIVGLPATHFIAAAGALIAIPLTWRWKLQTGAGIDLTPSMHWPAPVITHEVENDEGPVLVTVEYRIDPGSREAFLTALEKLAHQRRRDGAYAWGVFEDLAKEGRFLETFLVESWLEHMRQHQRVTNADRILQNVVHQFQVGGAPKVTHFIAAEPGAPREQ